MEKDNLIYGIRPLIEAIRAGKEIDKVFIQNGLQNQLFNELKTLIKEHNIVFQYVPVEKLNRITRSNHQGIIAFTTSVTYQNIENIIPYLYEKGIVPLILILDRITDVRNFGAIARSAECLGVNAIIIPSKGAAMVNSDAVKTSAGALHKIPVCRVNNLKNVAQFLQQSGLQVVSCTEKAAKNLDSVSYKSPTAVILGSEEDGISNDLIKLSDHLVKIPMKGEIESLNVSVSSGILLYEIIRQRGV